MNTRRSIKSSLVRQSAVAVTAACMLVLPLTAGDSDERSSAEKSLIARGIEPTVPGLREFFQKIHPDVDQRQRAKQLVALLGDEKFEVREQATQDLFLMPALPLEELQSAINSTDPEISWRAEALLKQGQVQFGQTLTYAFRVVAEKELKGLSIEILDAMPFCDQRHQFRSARSALVATAIEAELPRMTEYLESTNIEIRAAATLALARAGGESMRDELKQVYSKPGENDLVRLDAARGMADYGDRESLPALIALMESEDVTVRAQACQVLRALTGQRFQFAAYDKDERRQDALVRWQEWARSEGLTAELIFPLDFSRGTRSYLNGNTLLAYGYQNKVAELDPSGEEIWSVSANGAWMADRLPNGNTVVAVYSENLLKEFAPDGEEVWQFSAPSILSVRALENGNLLIGQHSPQLVREVTHEDEVVWEYSTTGSCCDAVRLDNGNTLVAAGDTVTEVTPDKEVVWTYSGSQVYGISITDSGTLLVAQLNGKVVEVNRESKEVIWEFPCSNPVDAVRLENGNTLITCNTEFVEVTPEKEIVWKQTGANYGSARR